MQKCEIGWVTCLVPMNWGSTDLFFVCFNPIVPKEVKLYKTFLEASYDAIPLCEDQWPPTRFQEYIKLETVLKVKDFTREEACTKAMIKGNLKTVKRMRQSIRITQVSIKHSCP